MQLRFTSFVMVSLRRDLHPQSLFSKYDDVTTCFYFLAVRPTALTGTAFLGAALAATLASVRPQWVRQQL